MKKLTNKVLALLLGLVMCVNFMLPVVAENERGVTFTAELDNATLQVSDQDQTVTMIITASQGVIVDGISFQTKWNNALSIVSISGGDTLGAYSPTGTNTENGKAYWGSSDSSNVENVTVLAVIVFNVPANTPAGEYILGVEDLELTSDYGEVWENAATATTTLTITNGTSGGDEGNDDAESDDYAVTVAKPSADLVAKGGEFTVNVNVNNAFNSARIELSYVAAVLEVVSCAATDNTDNTCSFDYATAGTIVILDYGAENASDVDYTVTFKANAATTGTDVKVASAGLSTADKAAVEDLTPVTNENLGTVSVPVGYTVTVPTTGDHTFTSSATTVLPNGKVTITANNPYYDYELEATNAILTKNQDGTWTLSDLTGDPVVTVKTPTPKSYDVTVKTVDKDGNPIDGIDDVITQNAATYGTAYVYTLPNDEDVVGGTGTKYSLVSIMVGGESGFYTTTDRTSTIEGQNVTGDIVITIRKEDKDPNAFTVAMTGETSAGQLSATQVEKGGMAVLTLNNKLAGYTYTVTATMGGQSVEVAQSGDEYTVANVTGNVVFTISKSLDTTNLVVSEYLSLNDKTMWLVTIRDEIEGKTYTYKVSENESANFFWSDKYGAYCYLIITDATGYTADTVKTDVASKLSLTDTAATEIVYTGNVNMSKNGNGEEVIDVNDAQLVWNMYNAYYSDFTQVSMEKFLRADMDDNLGIGTGDAAEIISIINPKN